METPNFKALVETLEGEHLKTLAEFCLHSLARQAYAEPVFAALGGGDELKTLGSTRQLPA